tara:strand:- start:1538 stop:2065 length:528 start_codon:yes stop_codon:yes gene_type:complete
MSCVDYCPEVHNASESEDSDYEVQSLPSEPSSPEADKEDCGQCWDCEENKDCPAKLNDLKEKENKIQKMIKEEVDKLVKPKVDLRETKEFKSLNNMTEEDKSKLSDLEKINLVAVAIHKNGGINVENIIELKQLVILIGATEQLEGFKDFPRDSVFKLLEMIIYHANSHMATLDI